MAITNTIPGFKDAANASPKDIVPPKAPAPALTGATAGPGAVTIPEVTVEGSPSHQKGKELFDRTWRVVIGMAAPFDGTPRSTLNDDGTITLSEVTVQAGGGISGDVALSTTEHDIKFEITKSIKSEPNKCKLTIYNLSEEQRAAIEELVPVAPTGNIEDKKKARVAARKQALRGVPVKIEAGYGGDNSLLWIGDLRTAKSEYNAPDWVTELESGDGEKVWQNARVNVSFGPSTPLDDVFTALVRELKIGEGNLAKIKKAMRIDKKIIPQGTVLSGPVATILTDWCRSADLEWSIQDGAIQFLDRGKALAERAIYVSSDSGMIKSPTVDVDGILTVEMLMVPDIRPGRLIVVESRRIKGNFKCETIVWNGDSSGNEWSVKISARRY
jgi:hypothetical protein